jgi:hypothetical protein
LPSVSWEGVEYAKSGWSQTWDTEFDVPEVSILNPCCWGPAAAPAAGLLELPEPIRETTADLRPHSQSVQHNASLWADIFVTSTGHSPDPSSSTYTDETLHVRKSELRAAPSLLALPPS